MPEINTQEKVFINPKKTNQNPLMFKLNQARQSTKEGFGKLNIKTKYSILFGSLLIVFILTLAVLAFVNPNLLPFFNSNDGPRNQNDTALVDVVDNLNGNQTFSDLIKKDSRTYDLISGRANFTIFTPSQDALNDIPSNVYGENPTQEQIDSINARIVQNHIVSGSFNYDSLSKLSSLNTIGGGSIQISSKDNQIYVNDVLIENKSIESQNGNIHFIDKVIYPDSLNPEFQARNERVRSLANSFTGSGWLGSEDLTSDTATISISDRDNAIFVSYSNINLVDFGGEKYSKEGVSYIMNVSFNGKLALEGENLIVNLDQVFSNLRWQDQLLSDEESQTIKNQLREDNLEFNATSSDGKILLLDSLRSDDVYTIEGNGSIIFSFNGKIAAEIEPQQIPQDPTPAEQDALPEEQGDPAQE